MTLRLDFIFIFTVVSINFLNLLQDACMLSGDSFDRLMNTSCISHKQQHIYLACSFMKNRHFRKELISRNRFTKYIKCEHKKIYSPSFVFLQFQIKTIDISSQFGYLNINEEMNDKQWFKEQINKLSYLRVEMCRFYFHGSHGRH